jgi:transposase
MGRWAQPVRSREQIVLFAPTLDESIPHDHPVRLFEEVFASLDFAEWERRYARVDGQPPIHPQVMAGVILYGLSMGIRSSRRLEDACGNRIDFMWLTHGRVIDHSTLAGFRVRFETELKSLFRQIGRVAIGLGMVNLNQVALDGTVKRSSNSRQAVARRTTLEQKLAALDERVEQLMTEANQTDKNEDELFGESSPAALPEELKDLKARQQKLAAALKKVRQIEDKQRERGRLSEKGPAVPVTDPDSSVMKNKTGGFAPNFLVVLATEGKNGLIMDYQVPEADDEPATVMPAVKNLREAYGEESVKQLLADSKFNTGSNLQQLKDANVEPWMPAKREPQAQKTQAKASPVALPESSSSTSAQTPSAQTPSASLPINPSSKKLDRSAFAFDEKADAYRCPDGRTLNFSRQTTATRQSGPVTIREYQSSDCGNCPLAGQCLGGKAKVRTVSHDEHEPLRQEMAARMATPQGRTLYRRRSFLAETPFAVLNTTMNVRQLLLRGIGKVRTEIGWICNASNLAKITRLMAESRRALSGEITVQVAN